MSALISSTRRAWFIKGFEYRAQLCNCNIGNSPEIAAEREVKKEAEREVFQPPENASSPPPIDATNCSGDHWSPHRFSEWVLVQNASGSARLFYRYCRDCLYVEEKEPPMSRRVP